MHWGIAIATILAVAVETQAAPSGHQAAARQKRFLPGVMPDNTGCGPFGCEGGSHGGSINFNNQDEEDDYRRPEAQEVPPEPPHYCEHPYYKKYDASCKEYWRNKEAREAVNSIQDGGQDWDRKKRQRKRVAAKRPA